MENNRKKMCVKLNEIRKDEQEENNAEMSKEEQQNHASSFFLPRTNFRESLKASKNFYDIITDLFT